MDCLLTSAKQAYYHEQETLNPAVRIAYVLFPADTLLNTCTPNSQRFTVVTLPRPLRSPRLRRHPRL